MGTTKFQRKRFATIFFLGIVCVWMVFSSIYGTQHFIKHYNEIPAPVLICTSTETVLNNTPIIKEITENFNPQKKK